MHRRGEVLDEIIATIGADAALRLVQAFGGITMAMGSDAPRELAPVVGIAAALRPVKRFSPGSLDVPRGSRWRGSHRNAELVARYAEGETQVSLALRFNLTERRIRQIIAAQRRAPESAGRTQA